MERYSGVHNLDYSYVNEAFIPKQAKNVSEIWTPYTCLFFIFSSHNDRSKVRFLYDIGIICMGFLLN